MLKELGVGKQATVMQCMDRTNENNKLYAVKIIKRNKLRTSKDDNDKVLVDELEVMKKLHHPHIVRLHEVIDDPDTQKIYLVMDNLEGGTI